MQQHLKIFPMFFNLCIDVTIEWSIAFSTSPCNGSLMCFQILLHYFERKLIQFQYLPVEIVSPQLLIWTMPNYNPVLLLEFGHPLCIKKYSIKPGHFTGSGWSSTHQATYSSLIQYLVYYISVSHLFHLTVFYSIASSFSTHLLRRAVLLHIWLQSPQLSSVPILSPLLRVTRWQETQYHAVCFSIPCSDSQYYEFHVSCWVPASTSWWRLRSGVSGRLWTACYGNAALESLIWAS